MKNQFAVTKKRYTYEIFTKDLSFLLSRFPFLSKETAGFSVLGKPIYAVRFGKGAQKIIITAAHHGKEWITSQLVLSLISFLCEEYEKGIKKRWNEKSFYFIPMVNPDGVNLCVKGLSDEIPLFIRNKLIKINNNKDFTDNWQANIRGVDLNHNYDASFSKGKALQISEGIYGPSPGKYSGEHPESEPETKAVVFLTKKVMPDIVIAYHSQGEEIFYKYQGRCAPNAYDIAKRISSATGYDLILADGLTDCTGYKDWVIEKFNIPAFTIEVGKGVNPLPLSQFEKIYNDNIKLITEI